MLGVMRWLGGMIRDQAKSLDFAWSNTKHQYVAEQCRLQSNYTTLGNDWFLDGRIAHESYCGLMWAHVQLAAMFRQCAKLLEGAVVCLDWAVFAQQSLLDGSRCRA
jgi:hypothetical protein